MWPLSTGSSQASLERHQGWAHFPYPRGGPYSVSMVDLAVIDGVFFRLHYPRRWHSDQEEKEADIKADFEHWPHLVPEARYVDEMFNFKFSSATLKMPASTGWVALALTENPLLPVTENGPLASEDNKVKFPVIIFSHGNSATRFTSSIMCADLASRGYIVAAIEHSDGSASLAAKVGDDGNLRWIPSLNPHSKDIKRLIRQRDQQNDVRQSECLAVHTVLRSLHNGTHSSDWLVKPYDLDDLMDLDQFRGRIDLKERVFIMGHSFGGATTIKMLYENPELFKAGICLDPWLSPIKSECLKLSQVRPDAKLFFLNYEMFQRKGNLASIRYFEKELEDVTCNVATLRNASHFAAVDFPTLLSKTWLSNIFSVLQWFRPDLGPMAGDIGVRDGEFSTDVVDAFFGAGVTWEGEKKASLKQLLESKEEEKAILYGTDYLGNTVLKT